jgi:hypothetical protein
MKHVLLEYKTLIVKMNNNAGEESKATQNLSFFFDVHMLLAFAYVIPLLESVNSLIKFAQSPNAFVNDYIAVVKIYQVEIYGFMLILACPSSLFISNNFMILSPISHIVLHMNR